jgi:hypothetical protein
MVSRGLCLTTVQATQWLSDSCRVHQCFDLHPAGYLTQRRPDKATVHEPSQKEWMKPGPYEPTNLDKTLSRADVIEVSFAAASTCYWPNIWGATPTIHKAG